MAFIDNNIQDLLDYMDERSQHVPTVYDCYGCKYNVGLIKGEHCRGCRMLVGDNWDYRQKPTKYEEEQITFTTQTGKNLDKHTEKELNEDFGMMN